ncbi:MAG: hypothetical protein NC191_03115 [Muribaculaceae bacterium]|nr:hypothetical protein [Muribaculaceae bacterium]
MKRLLLIISIIFVFVFTCACDKEKAYILFNNYPFSAQTINSPSNTNIFKSGQRIYYLVTFPEKSQSKLALIQIFKMDGDKDERLGYDLVWGKRVKLRQEQVFYYSDYVVLNKSGNYVMSVYSRDNPNKLLTSANFYVKN